MTEIVPTILTRSFDDLQNKIKLLEGLTDRVQVDIIDGVFLPEKTVDLESLSPENLETNLKLDLHLMVKAPEKWIERSLLVLADQIIGQVEMMDGAQRFIAKTIEAGMKVGLGLDVETPVSVIDSDTLTKIDLVLVLTRKAGFGVYEFDEKALEKVRFFRKNGGEYLKICVDGGVNEENIQECVNAGADIIAVGGAIWKAKNIALEIDRLRDLVNSV